MVGGMRLDSCVPALKTHGFIRLTRKVLERGRENAQINPTEIRQS